MHLNPRIEASVPESDVMDPDRWAQTELLSWCSMGALDALRKPASRGDRQTVFRRQWQWVSQQVKECSPNPFNVAGVHCPLVLLSPP